MKLPRAVTAFSAVLLTECRASVAPGETKRLRNRPLYASGTGRRRASAPEAAPIVIVIDNEPYERFLGMESVSMSLSPTEDSDAMPCDFCPDGVLGEDVVIPGSDGITCGESAVYAPLVNEGSDDCDRLGDAATVCCPEAVHETTSCSFCGSTGSVLFQRRLAVDDEELVIPNSVVEDSNGMTCGTAYQYASTLSDEECSTLQMAESLCCPDMTSWEEDLSMSMYITSDESPVTSEDVPVDAPATASPTSPPTSPPSPEPATGPTAPATTTAPVAPAPMPDATNKLPSAATTAGASFVASVVAIAVVQFL